MRKVTDVNEPLRTKFWGDFACFTNQDCHPERYSYPVPTPSAARGMLEAIFWKPEFRYQPISISILKPIQYILICRNEVKFEGNPPYDVTKQRTQIYTKALRNVAYIIEADIVPHDGTRDSKVKNREQFIRRRDRGSRYHVPCFGCREFPAYFCKPDGTEEPISVSKDLGAMFYGLDYKNGNAKYFFHSKIEDGVMVIPNLGI